MDFFGSDLILWWAAFAVLLSVSVSVAAWWSRKPLKTEIARLKHDIRAALARSPDQARLILNGRQADFVDIAASVNRLLEREQERRAKPARERALFDALADALPDAAVVHGDTILYANQSAGVLLGVEPQALIGRPITDLLRPVDHDAVQEHLHALLADAPVDGALEVQLAGGGDEERWAELHSRRTMWHGRPALMTVARDISRHKRIDAWLARSVSEARLTLESIGEGVVTTDAEGVIDYMNEAAEELIGMTRGFAVGKRLGELIALVDEVDRDSLGDPVQQCLTEQRRVNLGRRASLLSKVGEREFSVELTASPIRRPGGAIMGSIVIFHDVSESRGIAREMSYQATHDALTGLVNRSEFERRLDAALKSACTDSVSHVIAYLDLDRFKPVNDTCGHIAGDNLLREVAALLKHKVRDSDTIARVGGDEFAMLLVGCPLDQARRIAEEICESIASYRFSWQQHVFDIGISIGMVEIGCESISAEALLGAADSACYVAKQQGGGCVHVYSARDEVVARERGEIQWLQRMQRALRENRFELHVQPIVAIGSQAPFGPAAEVLLRIRDDDGKRAMPAQFLGAAERYHLMSHVDRWVVQSTLSAMAGGALVLPDDRTCSINLSGQTLGDSAFLEFIVAALDHSGIAPTRICFELRESALVQNLSNARRFVGVLHGLGCRFALDNFGSGIGSFAILRRLPFDFVKIDGVYTRNLGEDHINREMVAVMIKLARTLNFRVIAEQIEDHASLEAARRLGVDFVQGFVVERPRPLR